MLKLTLWQKKQVRVQVVNRCVFSGRSRGVLKNLNCLEFGFVNLLAKGQLQGTTKSSW
jgi:ribosomal protein S14